MYYNSDSIEDMIECLDKHKYDYTQYKHKNGYCSINSDILLNQLKLNKQELRANVIDEFAEAIRSICYKYPIGIDADTNEPLYGHEDGTWHNLIDDVSEQMKEV